MKVWLPRTDILGELGEVPDAVRIEAFDPHGRFGPADMPSDPAGVRFWVPSMLSTEPTTRLVDRLPELRVVQLMTAGAEVWIDRVPDGVALCDARGVHGSSTSEWVVGAILASIREFGRFVRAHDERKWDYTPTDELAGKRVLVVGAGDVGEAICRRLEPFDVSLIRVARTARPGVYGVLDLLDLLPQADVVVLVVPLTEATTGMVDAAFLAAMADGALLVNAARGPVLDTDALVAELTSGRLRAALDVVDPEPLPPEHPLWTAPGLFLTPHVAGSVPGVWPRAYRLVGAQLRRFAAGEPLVNVVTDGY